jgi:hypothetical protein
VRFVRPLEELARRRTPHGWFLEPPCPVGGERIDHGHCPVLVMHDEDGTAVRKEHR